MIKSRNPPNDHSLHLALARTPLLPRSSRLLALATHPVAEIGMNDDWSYVQTARILAQTGHIVYNGQGAPILGWQLFLAAPFIKLFGPSFAAIRASTLLVALLTAFLAQRTLVRTGINSRNATIGTLTLVLSPLFLSLSLSFMTDVGGLFCILLCLYACLRALAGSHRPRRPGLARLCCTLQRMSEEPSTKSPGSASSSCFPALSGCCADVPMSFS